MKIRLGFVSNSSSSSFVAVGSKLGHGAVYSEAEELLKAGRLYAQGSWCCEGVDFFKMTPDMWKKFMEGNIRGYFEFYNVQLMAEEFGTIKKSDIDTEEFEVHIFDVDYRHTDSLSDFEDRYVEEV